MAAFFLRRLLVAIPTLWVIISVAFVLVHSARGGPFDQEQRLQPEIKANLQAAYGLDQSIWRQYSRYLTALAHGDFGPSFKYKDFTVTELIRTGLPISLGLGAAAMLCALLIGVPLGIVAALWHRSWIDHAVVALAGLGIAVPTFVVLPLLGLIFAIHWHWLPIAGWESGSFRHLVLPVAALALPPIAYIVRLTRGSMIEVMHSGFVRTAYAKGLPLHSIILRHALRPALIPVVSYLGPALAAILTGSLVVESIAGLPGIGRHLVQGALNRDYTLVLGMVVVYSTLTIVMGLVVDLLYGWLDPRVTLT
jgi:oligopeptide transport system permease protein